MVRGDGSRRRRGCDVDSPCRRVAAATTRIFGRDRRGRYDLAFFAGGLVAKKNGWLKDLPATYGPPVASVAAAAILSACAFVAVYMAQWKLTAADEFVPPRGDDHLSNDDDDDAAVQAARWQNLMVFGAPPRPTRVDGAFESRRRRVRVASTGRRRVRVASTARRRATLSESRRRGGRNRIPGILAVFCGAYSMVVSVAWLQAGAKWLDKPWPRLGAAAYAAYVIHPVFLNSWILLWVVILRSCDACGAAPRWREEQAVSTTRLSNGYVWLGWAFTLAATQATVWPCAYLLTCLPAFKGILV